MIVSCKTAMLFLQLAIAGRTENGSVTSVCRYCYSLSRALTRFSLLPDDVREVSVYWSGQSLVIAVFYESEGVIPLFVVRSYGGGFAEKLYRLLVGLNNSRIVLTSGPARSN